MRKEAASMGKANINNTMMMEMYMCRMCMMLCAQKANSPVSISV